MKSTNEKNLKPVNTSWEKIQCQKIENLYHQIIQTEVDEKEYRKKLVSELLQMQKPDGSFRVMENCLCDSDIRVAYIYFPTYYGTAALMYAILLEKENDVWKDVLVKGFAIAMERHLIGHGYDAESQQLEALNIYKKAKLYEFLQVHGKEYDAFGNMVKGIIENYRTKLVQNQTVSSWMKDFRDKFEQEVIDFDINMVKKVWYAAYGSNINEARFMEYIQKCKDTTMPVQSKPIMIAHNIYFSGNSKAWEGKGTAFLDDTSSGMSLGRMYLITVEQFLQIQKLESSKYSKKIHLGKEDGLPIYSFSAQAKRPDSKSPSLKYLNTILNGLKDVYPEYSETTLFSYLLDSGIINAEDRRILSFIRNSEHGVTLQEIADYMFVVTKAKKSVQKLVDLGLLKQDRRSIVAGHLVTSMEAVFYTNKERRDVIVSLLLMHR